MKILRRGTIFDAPSNLAHREPFMIVLGLILLLIGLLVGPSILTTIGIVLLLVGLVLNLVPIGGTRRRVF